MKVELAHEHRWANREEARRDQQYVVLLAAYLDQVHILLSGRTPSTCGYG